MPLILHTGFEEDLPSLREATSDAQLQDLGSTDISGVPLTDADVVLLGPDTRDLLKTLQRISRADELISTLVIANDESYDSLKNALLFTPFVSKSASIVRLTHKHLSEKIREAASLTRRRRKFARVSVSLEKQTPPEKRATLQLQDLGRFLDQAPIGAIILNKEGTIFGINAFARRLFDVPPVKTVRTIDDILDKVSVALISRHMNKKSPGGFLEILSGERYFEVHFAQISDERQEDLEILLLSDITERKLENQRIRSVLDALPQMAWTTNAEGEVTYLTQGWYAFTGQSYSDALGKGWADVLHPDDRSHFLSKWRSALNAGTPVEAEARYRRHDGQFRWHLVRGTPMQQPSGTISYWLGTCTDIHDQKQIQETLSEQVKDRTAELTEVNELLKRSNNDLREFAYVASHDLKEPVRKIKIFLDRHSKAPPEQKEMILRKIKDAAQRMSALIDGIMAYSDVSASSNFEEVDLNELLNSVLIDLEVMMHEKKGKVTFDRLPTVHGLRTQLSQLFNNLILNSLKYTERSPVITITCRKVGPEKLEDTGLKLKQDYYEIAIADNGIGFNEKYSQEIFKMFMRLHNKDEYSGAGIGLALVKKIVTNHSGFIRAHSEENKGATFKIYLPVPQINGRNQEKET